MSLRLAKMTFLADPCNSIGSNSLRQIAVSYTHLTSPNDNHFLWIKNTTCFLYFFNIES